MSFLEVSHQSLEGHDSQTVTGPLAESRPLHELTSVAPSCMVRDDQAVFFPFANDSAVAPTMRQLESRTETAEYRAARNRVAVVVGESSLAASLQFIPEDTVIVLDYSPPMCSYMQAYVDTLRVAAGPKDWREKMGSIGRSALDRQISAWQAYGFPHALEQPSAFDVAQGLAREKAIVIWEANVLHQPTMARLGQSLVDLEATVTFLNLTNVMQYGNLTSERSVLEFADTLAGLPTTPEAPIMATSYYASPLESVGAVGPFFGLDNLRRSAGVDVELGTRTGNGTIIRQYADGQAVQSLARSISDQRGAMPDCSVTDRSPLILQVSGGGAKLPGEWLLP